jgi:hypothetical protein
MPRQSLVIAAMFAMIAVMAGARPALAAYGAFAYDEGARKFGYSHDEASQKAADAAALKGCASGGCRIVFRTGPRECGALASGETGTAWGGAAKPTLDAAKLSALENCQKRASGKCTLQASECNR